MEDDQWQDPLLITDVSWQQEHTSHFHCKTPLSLDPTMADSDDLCPNSNQDESWRIQGSEASFNEYFTDPETSNVIDGRAMLGFSLTTPDLVLCAGSPDIPSICNEEESNRFLNCGGSIELSLENGINGGSEVETSSATRQFSVSWKMGDGDLSSESSLELLPVPKVEDNLSSRFLPVLSINAGSLGEKMTLSGADFVEDSCFSGGEVVATEPESGNGDGLLALYRTARIGNFSYHLKTLGRGSYMVDLHFAEIVLTDGRPGMRVFDVYLQDQKAVSCIDINERVGANRPLVISNLRTSVSDDEGLFIRFEGVVGSPLVCGISVRKDLSASFGEVEFLKAIELSQVPDCKTSRDSQSCEGEGDVQNLQEAYERQKRELNETRRAIEELKSENERKSRECQEACKSLKDLQNELMRKSMHVGSLAFAIEGQVKEKSKWFTSLRDLKRKMKLLKMDHIKLSEEALLYKNCLEDINHMSNIIQTNFNQQVALHEELKLKFIKGSKERKELYNKVLELKGNIRVFCRCRPLNSEEITAGASMAVDFEAAKDGELTVKSNGSLKKTFKYDAVFDPQSSQADVFEDTAPFVTSVLDGYNVCIFAYGQTGTGKTFTMEGTEEARGVNFRTLDELFRVIKERKSQFKYEISVSVLEVYNEQIRDLLVSGTPSGANAKRLEVRQVGEGTHHVPGLVEANVSDMREVWDVLQTGSNARAVGSTNANEHSSRSHCIHLVMVKGENLLNGEITRSKLWLVDLAGSERVAKTEVQGERLKETQNINRSLSALGDVISALATKSPHIPFRNSKLTHLLQDSLGGDSKTLMFVQISPNENDLSETLCSLNFASRVRGVELGPAKKQLDSTELFKYKQSVEKSKLELKTKDVQIKKLEDTLHVLDVKMKEKDLKNKTLQDKIKELESQLMVERRLARQHVDSKIVEHQQQAMREQQQEEQCARPPLVAKPLTAQKNLIESQEQVNQTRPLTENNSYKIAPIAPPPLDDIVKQSQKFEKENANPEIADRLVPKRTGRASFCPMAAPRIQPASAQRRNSLIPMPSAPNSTKFQPLLLPLSQIIKEEKDEGEVKSIPELTTWDSPKEHKSVGQRKISSILRRSMQKRVQIRSPMHQNARRGIGGVGGGGINLGGMEKVRLSIGGRGRIAHRVLPGTVRRPMRDVQQKQINHKEKERGWNSTTTGKI